MKILVTGGAGYIGSSVVRQLVRQRHTVLALDNLSMGHRPAVDPAASLVVADLADAQDVDRVLKEFRPEAVLHFAARTLVGESMERPFLYLRENLVNGIQLIEAAARRGVRRFVLSSTANLFGDAGDGRIAESAPIVPGSPYGESKHLLERVLHWTDRILGMRYCCLRYFNACGADSPDHGEDHTPETHLIPLVLQVALGQRKQITLFGDDYPTPDGSCVRDYIHVSDLADAHLLALGALEQGSCVYNLGNGRGFSVREVIAAARRVTGCEIPEKVGPRRAGDPAVLVASSARIRAELDWSPRYRDLDEIIETAWNWHRSHPQGYD